MFLTIALAAVGGFMVGNGLPYYLEGSAGRGRNPSPFPDRPWVAVLVGIWTGDPWRKRRGG